MTTEILHLKNIERKLFWIAALLLGGAISFYFMSVFSMTVAVVERTQAISSYRELLASSGDLEQSYMNIQNGMTLSHAKELGFKEASPLYATIAPHVVATIR